MEILDLINRKHSLLDNDIIKLEKKISNKIKNSSFLVLGGAGSIGQSVSKEIFKRKPIKLPIDKSPFTTSILPIPIVNMDDNKTKKLVVDINWASYFATVESISNFLLRKLSK